MKAKQRLDRTDHSGTRGPRRTGRAYAPPRALPPRTEEDTTPRAVFFLKSGDTLTTLTPTMVFKIGRKDLRVATTGFIRSASRPDVETAAVSGWMPNPTRGPGVLDNLKYFRLVQEFAQFLKFRLETSFRDNNGKVLAEHRGRFVASHVEKKLAVFWVMAALKANLATTEFTRLRELRSVSLPAPWLKAVVFLDHKPCNNCLAFLRAIKLATNIEIRVRTCHFLVEGHRRGESGCHNCPCNRCRGRFGVGQQERERSQASQAEMGCASLEGSVIDPNSAASSSADRERIVGCASHQGRETGQADLQPARDSGGHGISPVMSSGPPDRWKSFTSDTFGEYAKPIWTPPGSHPAEATHLEPPSSRVMPTNIPVDASGDNLRGVPIIESLTAPLTSQRLAENNRPGRREPVHTPGGRSGYPMAPGRSRLIEVLIPSMDARTRAEYDRVSDISGTCSHTGGAETVSSTTATSKRSRKSNEASELVGGFPSTLSLERFAYEGSKSIAGGVSTSNAREGQSQRRRIGATGRKAARLASGGKRSRARVAREEMMRARSLFLRAAEHRQRC